MKVFAGSLAAFCLLLAWAAASAWAAKSGVIQGKGVTLYSEPNKSGPTLGTLKQGDAVVMSNYPTQGFYKVRTSMGVVGWVDAGAITEDIPAPAGEPTQSAPKEMSTDTLGSPGNADESEAPSVPTYEDAPESSVNPEHHLKGNDEERETPRLPIEVRAFGGLQLIQPSGLNAVLGSNLFTSMVYFGAQGGFPLTQDLQLLVRIEDLKKSVTSNQDAFTLSSTPIMTGFAYSLGKKNKAHFQVSYLAGLGFSTALNLTANNQAAPNVSTLTSTAFTQMLKFDVDIPVAHRFEIFGEGGYRMLKTASVGPNPAGNGVSVLQANGQNVPISLDLSGFFIGAGVGVFF